MNIKPVVVLIAVVVIAVSPAIAQDASYSIDIPTILSDTLGYDFARYIGPLMNRVRYHWYMMIPEEARRGEKGKVVVIFTIVGNGAIQNLHVVVSSKVEELDRAATAAIKASDPFAPLPADFKGAHIDIELDFLYNIKSKN